jgi:drug/metabolite transporter (DMT)-like permease
MDQNFTHAQRRHAGSLFAVVFCAAMVFGAAATHAQSTQQPSETAAVNQVSVATVPVASRPTATRTDPFFEERPQPAAVAASFAAGILVVVLIAAGILLIVRGLRDDLRDRKRSYRRRSRRIFARSSRPPITPAS